MFGNKNKHKELIKTNVNILEYDKYMTNLYNTKFKQKEDDLIRREREIEERENTLFLKKLKEIDCKIIITKNE